ncbi:MAG: hypothetical protein QM760_21710 [Nibricoccus sp.]
MPVIHVLSRMSNCLPFCTAGSADHGDGTAVGARRSTALDLRVGGEDRVVLEPSTCSALITAMP